MTRSLLCSTVSAPGMEELCLRRDAEAKRADLVELRLDSVERADVERALSGRTCPVIVTVRSKREGGAFAGSEEERLGLLCKAMRAGAEYVDIEWEAFREAAAAMLRREVEARAGKGIVLSMHDFDAVPSDIDNRVREMASAGSEVVKVAVTPRRLSDCIRLAEIARANASRRVAMVGMGPRGIATRVLPRRFGSCWTYAGAVAPGQISAADMLQTYGFSRIADSTLVFGLAGSPVAHSFSPAMHNAWFERSGFAGVYLALDTDDVDDFFSFAEWLPVAGASVTAPLKTAVFARLQQATGACEKAGAVNTIRKTNAGWCGINTDVGGFLAPFQAHGVPLRRRRCAVVGAGGAARAVVVALHQAGAFVTVHARKLQPAEEVAAIVGGEARQGLPEPGTWDVLVNATPKQWDGAEFGLGQRLSGSARERVVYDLISNPPVTPLLQGASHAGYLAISGLEMLIAQAELQAEWWTGTKPSAGLMRAVALRAGLPRRGDARNDADIRSVAKAGEEQCD